MSLVIKGTNVYSSINALMASNMFSKEGNYKYQLHLDYVSIMKQNSNTFLKSVAPSHSL